MVDGSGALGRELRQGVGAELRADAEEAERLAALAARRRRTLADVAAHLRARGDTVAVDVPGQRFSGRVVHAGADVVRVLTVSGPVDVNLSGPVTLAVLDRSAGGGSDPTTAPETFRSRLLELELAGAEVELGDTSTGGPVVGRLTAVAIDHVVVADVAGGERYLSLRSLVYVRPR